MRAYQEDQYRLLGLISPKGEPDGWWLRNPCRKGPSTNKENPELLDMGLRRLFLHIIAIVVIIIVINTKVWAKCSLLAALYPLG